MTAQIEIRDAVPSEHAAIESLYDEAFPDADLRPLLQDLHRAQSGIASLVG